MSTILVIGGGGREHAIVTKLCESDRVGTVYVAPGNGGTEGASEKVTNVPISDGDSAGIVKFCTEKQINFVAVGPEIPLANGLADDLAKVGVACFGPSKAAAMIESSKAFSKDFMAEFGIPTAAYVATTDFQKALAAVRDMCASGKVVVKASGLAAGKGVLLPETLAEAEEAVEQVMLKKEFGEAGTEVVVEEFLGGQEVSVLAFTDGHSVVAMPGAQDHKRRFEGDEGPNTGGMGAYAPAPLLTPALAERVVKEVLQPAVDGMRKRRTPYCGVLYAGLMVDGDKLSVLEFNCRMGDPETQVVMPLLKSDLFGVMEACCGGFLDTITVEWHAGSAATVVAVSEGYPGSYPKGKAIDGCADAAQPGKVQVFHAGTATKDGSLVTSGGRVLAVTCVADSIAVALEGAYAALAKIQFEGMGFRKDIGHRVLNAAAAGSSYKDAGVDIDAGEELVRRIGPAVKQTQRSGGVPGLKLKGVFDCAAAGYKDPLLVSGADGVGTKLLLAKAAKDFSTVGIDLVAMCVNDVLMHGAEPMFFLDYYASGKLDVDQATAVIKGVAEGCVRANCQLAGGETAEMPGMYPGGDFDLAGFAVGAVERDQVIPRDVSEGDICIGLASSGVHSNGFSLVRHILANNGIALEDQAPFEEVGVSIVQSLLKPTKIYVNATVPLIKSRKCKALCHITGGGLTQNLPRVLPTTECGSREAKRRRGAELGFSLDASKWKVPPVFKWLGSLGNVAQAELVRTFNMGIGMVALVAAADAASVMEQLQSAGEEAYIIGSVTPLAASKEQVVISNLEALLA